MSYLPTQQNISAGVYPGSGVAAGGQVGRPQAVHNGVGATPKGVGLNVGGSIRKPPPGVPLPGMQQGATLQDAHPGHMPMVHRRAVLAGAPPNAQGPLGSGVPGDAAKRPRPPMMDSRF